MVPVQHIEPMARVVGQVQKGLQSLEPCLPHETAVAWARAFMKKRPLDRSAGMPGMITQLRRVLQDGEDYINSEYDVDKLCGGEFLERMAELKDREGDRLKH